MSVSRAGEMEVSLFRWSEFSSHQPRYYTQTLVTPVTEVLTTSSDFQRIMHLQRADIYTQPCSHTHTINKYLSKYYISDWCS